MIQHRRWNPGWALPNYEETLIFNSPAAVFVDCGLEGYWQKRFLSN